MATAETKFDLDKILRQLGGAFLTASRDLRREFDKKEWEDIPFIYHLPKMRVSMQVALSYSDGKVHGNFITGRRTKTEEAELVTTIDVDLVSVPREVEGPTKGREEQGKPPSKPGEKTEKPSEEETEKPSEEENGGEAAPTRPMPTWIRLPPSGNVMPARFKSLMEKLGFTDVRDIKKEGAIFRLKAKWQGEDKKLRVDARVGSISESKR